MNESNNDGKLTTHVLDTSTGKPAVHMTIELWSVCKSRTLLVKTTTNLNGRVDQPLLQGDTFKTGIYELNFQVGEYFRNCGVSLPEVPFLDNVVLRFGICKSDEHYHVPLLISPFGYTTYRGS